MIKGLNLKPKIKCKATVIRKKDIPEYIEKKKEKEKKKKEK